MATRPGHIQGVLFDKDGTLIDFQASWPPCYRELAIELAEGDRIRAEGWLRSGGMDPETGRVAAGTVLAAGNTRDIVRAWFPDSGPAERAELEGRVDAAFLRNARDRSVAVEGLAGVLEELLRVGLRLGVATSDSTAAAQASMAQLGVADRFLRIIGYDAVAAPKPAPDMVLAFAAATGLSPAELAVVGDNTHDLLMARAAGAGAAVGVLTGTSSRADLDPLADVVLESIAMLPDWLAHVELEAAQKGRQV